MTPLPLSLTEGLERALNHSHFPPTSHGSIQDHPHLQRLVEGGKSSGSSTPEGQLFS